MWRSCLLEELRRDAERVGVLADVRQRGARRLLHHRAELTGQRDLPAAAGQQRGLDVEHVAAGLGPRDAGRDARPRRPELVLRADARRPEVVGDVAARPRAPCAIDPVATRAATLRAIVPICRSRLRTPASRVYSRDRRAAAPRR